LLSKKSNVSGGIVAAIARPIRILTVTISMLIIASCTLENPEGTSWDVEFHMISAPETLFVREAGDNSQVDFSFDSLLVFKQEFDTVYARLGDSLRWESTEDSYAIQLDELSFEDMGSAAQTLPLYSIFPALEALDGTEQELTALEFSSENSLPAFSEFEWIDFIESNFEIEIQHQFPFSLENFSIEFINEEDEQIGSVDFPGILESGVSYTESFGLVGYVTNEIHFVISGFTVPMDSPALISNQTLVVNLDIISGSASAARAESQGHEISLLDSLISDERLYILEAIADSLQISYSLFNGMGAAIDMMVTFPELYPGDGTEPLVQSLENLLPNETRLISLPREFVRFNPGELSGDQYLRLEATGSILESEEFVTMQIGDEVELTVLIDNAELSSFHGQFRQEQIIAIEDTTQSIDEFPEELLELDIDGLDVWFIMDNSFDLAFDLEMDVVALFSGIVFDSYNFDTHVDSGADKLIFSGMGPLISFMPNQLDFSGQLVIPAGNTITMNSESTFRLTSLDIPAQIHINQLVWAAEPEFHDEEVPEEVGDISMQVFIQSTVPLGGAMIGMVGNSNEQTDVELFDFTLRSAPFVDGESQLIADTLNLEISPDAIDVMMDGDWWLQFYFASSANATDAGLYADQWLAIQVQIDADIGVDFEEE
jgi:hypothetical protein